MDANDPMAALLFRKAQLQAQEQAAMGQAGLIGNPQAQAPQGAMSQAQFSGYGKPQMTPLQVQQLLMLLRARAQPQMQNASLAQ